MKLSVEMGCCAALTLSLIVPCIGQEMSCKDLLRHCGDGPYENKNVDGVLVSIGGGSISNQCVGIINGVLASYQTCHGQLAYSGAAAILLHFVHENPELSKQTGWECARAAFAKVFACQQQ
jgi:hypothetical protein